MNALQWIGNCKNSTRMRTKNVYHTKFIFQTSFGQRESWGSTQYVYLETSNWYVSHFFFRPGKFCKTKACASWLCVRRVSCCCLIVFVLKWYIEYLNIFWRQLKKRPEKSNQNFEFVRK